METEVKKRKSFSYDEYSDSLIVSNRQENEIVRENFEVGDIIFSLTGKGKIVSIEIREFSSFLENCNVNLDLKNIEDAELKILPRKDTLFLIITKPCALPHLKRCGLFWVLRFPKKSTQSLLQYKYCRFFLGLKIKSLDNNVILSKNIPLVVPLINQ